MTRWAPAERLPVYLLRAAFGLSAAAAAATLLLPIGGAENRIAGAAVPLVIAAAACAALAYFENLQGWLPLVLYAVVALAITYALMAVAAVPLRLSVTGVCPSTVAVCPVGFERLLTTGESNGIGAAIALGFLAIACALFAAELRYRPRLRVFGRSRTASAPSAAPKAPTATPPPAMRPSAIPKKPAISPVEPARAGQESNAE